MNQLASPLRMPRTDELLGAPWSRLDDERLLAHFTRRRSVRFQPVIDPDEIQPARIEGVMRGLFEFNGETHALPAPVDWLDNPSDDVEWHILLHKAYYLAGVAQAWQATGQARYAQRWAELIDGWMAVTPPGFIAADVTGRRVQNWITSLHALVLEGRAGEAAPVSPALWRRVLHSLHEQVEYLCAHLTAKRNHRTLELMAIFIAGVVFPEFGRSAHWREFALRETMKNIQDDLQSDGVHCEQSTDYHHLALRNWLQVRQLAEQNGVAVPEGMDQALECALVFSMHVHQPSGRVPSFSDGDARSYLPLLAQGARLFRRPDMRFVATGGQEGTAPLALHAHFPASGYHVLRSAWDDPRGFAQAQHLVLDCGPLGEGNHGHFDALSFELAAGGQPLIVDPGRYTYSEAGDTNWRVLFRGTGVHNTVEVDGQPQTRYLPRTIKPGTRHASGSVRHKIAGPGPETRTVEVQHRGRGFALVHGVCRSHEYDAVHDRCVVMVGGRYWIVSDWLRSPGEHRYRLNFQLSAAAQGLTQLQTGASGVQLRVPGLWMVQPLRSGHTVSLAPGWVSELYGHKAVAPRWITGVSGGDVDFDTLLVAGDTALDGLHVSDGLADAEDGRRGHFLRISGTEDGQPFTDGWWHARGATPGRWSLDGMVFEGRWLHWRNGADGRLLQASSHPGASLCAAGQPVALDTGVAA